MKYTKPHLSYDKQLELLSDRGLHYSDLHTARSALRSIGYYRLSAYTYPLRAKSESTDGRGRALRSDRFVSGARLEDALALCRFDQDLRLSLLDALQQIEVGMRVQIGYQLGKTDPFGHLDRKSLDARACARRMPPGRRGPGGTTQDAHDDWLSMFRSLQASARHEEFVKHFTTKYDGLVPIWVATEFMTFGCLTYLYQLLGSKDASKIAGNLDIRNRDLVHKWLKALNVLRNHCAHNGRIWNRSTVFPPKRPPMGLTPERLHHLRAADPDRLYFLAALTGHMVIELSPQTNWPARFRARMQEFPVVHGMTPENTMGFVKGWADLALWNHNPRS